MSTLPDRLVTKQEECGVEEGNDGGEWEMGPMVQWRNDDKCIGWCHGAMTPLSYETMHKTLSPWDNQIINNDIHHPLSFFFRNRQTNIIQR